MTHHGFQLPFSIAGRVQDARKEVREELKRLSHYTAMARELASLPKPVQAAEQAHSFDLKVAFDSLALYPGTSPGPDGVATIGYISSGRWWIVGLELDPYYGKETIAIPSCHPLYRVVRDALQLSWADHIQAKVDADLEERGWVQDDPNEDARLGARQLGVGL